jgi:hypothetical protein
MTTIYLSGPVSLGGTTNPGAIKRNVARFKAVAAELRRAGHNVLDPTDSNGDDSWPWDLRMREAVAMLVRADRVGTLPGWQRSRGALLEVHLAPNLGMEVTDLSYVVELVEAA